MAERKDSNLTYTVPIDDMPQTLVRNADGTINYVEATDGYHVWRQTFTYTSGAVTGISAWVKQ